MNVFQVSVYPVKHFDCAELIEQSAEFERGLDVSRPERGWYLGDPTETTLRLNLNPSEQKKGGFKLTSFGSMSDYPSNFDGVTSICGKQAFEERIAIRDKGVRTGLTRESISIPLEPHCQLATMAMEIACLVWAQGLLDIVYDFIKLKKAAGFAEPPTGIPPFRFVKAALAIEWKSSGKTGAVFLVEERIERDCEGPFRKYMNNVSAVPLKLRSPADEERAEFLAFSQHVQYTKTANLVFVSDYQGTPPQSLPFYICLIFLRGGYSTLRPSNFRSCVSDI